MSILKKQTSLNLCVIYTVLNRNKIACHAEWRKELDHLNIDLILILLLNYIMSQ